MIPEFFTIKSEAQSLYGEHAEIGINNPTADLDSNSLAEWSKYGTAILRCGFYFPSIAHLMENFHQSKNKMFSIQQKTVSYCEPN